MTWERKTFLRVLAGSAVGLTFTDPLGDFATTATTGGQRRIGQVEVDEVRYLARMFAGQDHTLGSGLSARAVVTQLSISAHQLDGRFAQEAVRRQLFSAVATLADVAGGMCFDAGSHAHAERCFRFAVGGATEADDWALRAKALSGLANLSVHHGRPDDALSFSEMALVRADRLTPLVRAVMHTRHARALGLDGGHREADCLTAVRQAEDYFVRQDGDEPDWMTYYDQAHLERDCGRALLHLAVNGGIYAEAQARLGAAIARFPDEQSRGKTLAIANPSCGTDGRNSDYLNWSVHTDDDVTKSCQCSSGNCETLLTIALRAVMVTGISSPYGYATIVLSGQLLCFSSPWIVGSAACGRTLRSGPVLSPPPRASPSHTADGPCRPSRPSGAPSGGPGRSGCPGGTPPVPRVR